jgi:hypothetical protein
MEAIVAGVMKCQRTSIPAMTPAPAVLEWHRTLAEHDRKWMPPAGDLSDAEWGAMFDSQDRLAKQAFAKPVQSWEDVALLGAIAMYWNFPHHDQDDLQYMQARLTQADHFGMDEQSIAHLLKAICTMGGFAPGEIPTEAKDDPSLSVLQQKLKEVDQLSEIAKGLDDEKDWVPARSKADAADAELSAMSERIFATRPITLHSLKLRAVLAKYWHQHRPDGEEWNTPSDCDAWEDQVIAHLIDGVLQISTAGV